LSEVRIAPTPGSATSGANVGMHWYRIMGTGTVFAVVFVL
jgi:predicted solute-binding protein